MCRAAHSKSGCKTEKRLHKNLLSGRNTKKHGRVSPSAHMNFTAYEFLCSQSHAIHRKGSPHRSIILHIMHMAHIIFFMRFSSPGIAGISVSAKSIHQKRRFVNPFLQFFKKKNSILQKLLHFVPFFAILLGYKTERTDFL